MRWDVLEDEDGCDDVHGLTEALGQARANREQPTFANVRTVIGVGSKAARASSAHGAAFGLRKSPTSRAKQHGPRAPLCLVR